MEIIIPSAPDDMGKAKSYLSAKLGIFLRDFYAQPIDFAQGEVLMTQFLPVKTIHLEEAVRGSLGGDYEVREAVIWRTLILAPDGTPLVTVDFEDGTFRKVSRGEAVVGLLEGLQVAEIIPLAGKFKLFLIEFPELLISALRLAPLMLDEGSPGINEPTKNDLQDRLLGLHGLLGEKIPDPEGGPGNFDKTSKGIIIPIRPLFRKSLRRNLWFSYKDFVGEIRSASEAFLRST